MIQTTTRQLTAGIQGPSKGPERLRLTSWIILYRRIIMYDSINPKTEEKVVLDDNSSNPPSSLLSCCHVMVLSRRSHGLGHIWLEAWS